MRRCWGAESGVGLGGVVIRVGVVAEISGQEKEEKKTSPRSKAGMEV